jgi:hypothetical protein
MDCWMDCWMDGWMDGLLDCWMAGLLDCWMAGWLDGWMAGNYAPTLAWMEQRKSGPRGGLSSRRGNGGILMDAVSLLTALCPFLYKRVHGV